MTVEKDLLVAGRASWRRRLAVWLQLWAAEIDPVATVTTKRGSLLIFERTGANLGHPVYTVRSVKAGFIVGQVDWSNSWRQPRFKADAEAVFDRQCLAEIFIFLRDYR